MQGLLVTPSAVAVMEAFPSFLADIKPSETDTIEGSLLDQEILSYSAADGSTVAVNVFEPPTVNVTALSLSFTLPTSVSHWEEDKNRTIEYKTQCTLFIIDILDAYPDERPNNVTHGFVIVRE